MSKLVTERESVWLRLGEREEMVLREAMIERGREEVGRYPHHNLAQLKENQLN